MIPSPQRYFGVIWIFLFLILGFLRKNFLVKTLVSRLLPPSFVGRRGRVTRTRKKECHTWPLNHIKPHTFIRHGTASYWYHFKEQHPLQKCFVALSTRVTWDWKGFKPIPGISWKKGAVLGSCPLKILFLERITNPRYRKRVRDPLVVILPRHSVYFFFPCCRWEPTPDNALGWEERGLVLMADGVPEFLTYFENYEHSNL